MRIFSPGVADRLYPYSIPVLRNTSQIKSTDQVDTSKFPRFADTPYQECILQPGQMLYLPRKCWHEVVSLSGSFSVSFWWT